MANAFDEFDQPVDQNTGRNPNAFDNYDGPVMKSRDDDGTLQGDSKWTRAMRTADDFMRALANGPTFGLASKVYGGVTGDYDGVQERTKQAAARSPVATAAGTIAGQAPLMAVGGAALGRAVPALGEVTIPSQMGNAAVVNGGMSVTDDLAHGNLPDPVKAVGSAMGGAAGVPVVQYSARALSPTARFRASGLDLTEADRAAATAAAKRAGDLGIPYSVPEAVAAGAPTNAARVEALANASAGSPAGSQVWANFEAGRPPLVAEAAKRTARDLQAGTPPVGLPSQQASQGAIKSAEDLVSNSADPYYKSAEKRIGFKAPQTEAVAKAKANVQKDPIVMEQMGNMPPSSLKFLDAVKKELGNMYERDVKRNNGETLRSATIASDKQALNSVLEKNPDYATGNRITEQGTKQLVEPVKAGPLGLMSKTPVAQEQADSLFNVGTAAEADAAINAGKRLPDGMPRGLLASRMEDMANRDPMAVGSKLLPTDEAKRVAGQFTSADQQQAMGDLIKVVKGMKQRGVAPHELGADNPLSEIWSRVKGYGGRRIAQMMQDPAMIAELGKQGIGQKAAIKFGQILSNAAADSQGPDLNGRRSD